MLLFLLLGSITDGRIEDVCYQLSWGAPGSQSHMMVHAVSEFPPNHALVNNRVCGQEYAAGEN